MTPEKFTVFALAQIEQAQAHVRNADTQILRDLNAGRFPADIHLADLATNRTLGGLWLGALDAVEKNGQDPDDALAGAREKALKSLMACVEHGANPFDAARIKAEGQGYARFLRDAAPPRKEAGR